MMQDNPYGATDAPLRSPSEPDETAALEHPIRFSGEVTLSDAWHALHVMQRTSPRRFWLVIMPLLVVCLLFTLVLAPEIDRFPVIWTLIIACDVVLILFVLVRWRTWRVYNRLANEGLVMFRPVEIELTTQEYRGETDDSLGILSWDSYATYRSSDRVVALILKGNLQYHILVRDNLVDPGDWPVLLDFLRYRFGQS